MEIIERNGWYQIDELFYGRKNSETYYEFVIAEWIDCHGSDEKAKNRKDDDDNYAICVGNIDVMDYKDNVMFYIEQCGHTTMESFIRIYGDDYNECLNEIIAEYEFKEKCICDANCITGVISKEEAEKEIQIFIDVVDAC